MNSDSENTLLYNIDMNKQEFLNGLERMNLPKEEFIILSGGSLLLRGIREESADFDICVSKKLAKAINLYNSPKDEKGFYAPFDNCQMLDDYDRIQFDVVDGYQCETLDSILRFKRKMKRAKDLIDIKKIEEYLSKK